MTRTFRRAALVVPFVVVAVAASGCGVADQTVHPGVAADVDGTGVSLRKVDDATTQLCEVTTEEGALDFYADGRYSAIPATPRAVVRQQVAATFILEAAARRVVEEQGVTVPTESAAAVRRGLSEVEDSDRLAEFLEAEEYLNAAVLAIGDAAGAPEAEAGQRGAEAVLGWLSDHDVEVNPVIDLEVTDEGLRPAADDDLSVPVSDDALASVIDFEDPGVEDTITAMVADLPADQVCGA